MEVTFRATDSIDHEIMKLRAEGTEVPYIPTYILLMSSRACGSEARDANPLDSIT